MALGVDQAIAELLVNGDPVRAIDGLSVEGFGLYGSGASKLVFVGEEQPQPDDAVTVILEFGRPPIPGAYGFGVGRRPSFSVRTRSASYATAQSVAYQVDEILNEYSGSQNGVPFFRIDAAVDPISLGRDREDRGGRWIWSQPFNSTTKRYSPS